MKWLRVGDRLVNLDLAQTVDFRPNAGDPWNHLSDQKFDRLWIDFQPSGDGTDSRNCVYLKGEQARSAWAAIMRAEANGEIIS